MNKNFLNPDTYKVGEIITVCAEDDCQKEHLLKFKILSIKPDGNLLYKVQFYQIGDASEVKEITLLNTSFNLCIPLSMRTLYHQM
jgi:hypothetical protein